MYIPVISEIAARSYGYDYSRIGKRAGGGGGRGGGGGGSVSGGGGKTSSGGTTSTGGKTSSGGTRSSTSADKPPPYSPGGPPPPYSVGGGRTVRGDTSNAGGGRPYTIASGNAFAGASAGGGTRGGVYGGRGYGSYGYLPFFPFMFWPVYFPTYGYYYGSSIYGPANNSSRPGGDLQSYTLIPSWASTTTNSTNTTTSSPTNGMNGPQDNTFAIYGDSNSVQDLVGILAATCSLQNVYGQNFTITPFNAAQFYRGDSFSLNLQGYNNSMPDIEIQDPSQNFTAPTVQPAALPSGVNQTYFNCLNDTIGSYVGLLDSDYVTDAASRRIGDVPQAAAGIIALLVLLKHFIM